MERRQEGILTAALKEVLRADTALHALLQWGTCDVASVIQSHPDSCSFFPEAAEFKYAIVLALPLPCSALTDVTTAPTPLYLHHYRQLNYILDRISYSVAVMIEENGYDALSIPASQYVTMSPYPRGAISHRVFAYYAGLGFIGRSRLLINRRYGARVRLTTILTNAPIKGDETVPSADSLYDNRNCGDCFRCVQACPAGAISASSEKFSLDRCLAKLSEFRKINFIGQHICGICIKVCPFSGILV
ncbi:MAG: hypothetical protein N2234_01235 [Planctomycetota bacterium]|nr:hypothetical protein [Planctomycetota bacterium]